MRNKSKILFIVLSVLLCFSVAVNIHQVTQKYFSQLNTLHGTYATPVDAAIPEKYLTFYDDGKYVSYEQNNLLDVGTYIQEQEVYTLRSGGENGTEYIFITDKACYCISGESEISIYEKISDIPLEINVEIPDFTGGDANWKHQNTNRKIYYWYYIVKR